MNTLRKILMIFLVCFTGLLIAITAIAQTPKGQGAATSQSTSQSSNPSSNGSSSSTQTGAATSGGSALQGFTYPEASWDQLRSLPPPSAFGMNPNDYASFWDNFSKDSFRKNVIIFCYKLVPTMSGTQPFTLIPSEPEGSEAAPYEADYGKWIKHENKYEMCANENTHKALLASRFIVFQIDMSDVRIKNTLDRIHALNINVASAAGTSLNSQRGSTLNPALTKPSLAAFSPQPFYTPSPKEQDVLRKYTLNGRSMYEAAMPCPKVRCRDFVYLTWPGELVGDTIPTVSVNLIYTPVAAGLPWKKETYYPTGSVVTSAKSPDDRTNTTTDGHYYLALNGGIAGSEFNVPTPVPLRTLSDPERELTWKDMGILPQGARYLAWAAGQPYIKGDRVVPSPANNHYYEALAAGTSGGSPPDFPKDGTMVTENHGLIWKCVGAAPIITKWAQGGTYTQGEDVLPPEENGHYYEATNVKNPGQPETSEPSSWPTDASSVPDKDKDITWKDMGPYPFPQWQSNTAYASGAKVVPNPANGFYYWAATSGVSGPNQPPFPVSKDASVTDSAGLVWMDLGSSSTQPAAIKNLRVWTPRTSFALGDGTLDPVSGHYYAVVLAGISGTDRPDFSSVPVAPPFKEHGTQGAIEWQDLGTTLPASISADTQPSDQTVNLLNLTYPQVQVLGRFNLTAGVVYNWIKTPACNTSNSTNTTTPCSPGKAIGVDPVLDVSVYTFKPVDAERAFVKSDFFVPAPTLGFSLSSPTSNYYLGFSSEALMRNLQFTYGLAIARMSVQGSTSGIVTKGGPFLGLSFNITGFIQSLFP